MRAGSARNGPEDHQGIDVVESILADLVAFPSLPATPNEIAGYVRDFLAGHGVEARLLPGPEGNRVNTLRDDRPATCRPCPLHMDVVPVEGQSWSGDPRSSAPKAKGSARGTADMKGFLACMLAMVPDFDNRGAASGVYSPTRRSCRGVPHLLARLPELYCAAARHDRRRADRGSVLSHKGKQAIELAIEGVAGHSPPPTSR
ncbi:MAG: M20/M25/M40 family metallo-hydrolase [Amaricoccus sp.]